MFDGEYTSKLTLSEDEITVKDAYFHDTQGSMSISQCTKLDIEHTFFEYSYNDYVVLVVKSKDINITNCCLYNCTLEQNTLEYGHLFRLYASNQCLVTDFSYTMCYEVLSRNTNSYSFYQNCMHAVAERQNNSFNTFPVATGPLITALKSISWKYLIAYESLTELMVCEFYNCATGFSASKLIFYKCDTTSTTYPLFWVYGDHQFVVSDSVFAWNRNICPLDDQITSERKYFTDSKDVVVKFGAKLGEGNTFWDYDTNDIINEIEVELPLGQFKCGGEYRGEHQGTEKKSNIGIFQTFIQIFSLLLIAKS